MYVSLYDLTMTNWNSLVTRRRLLLLGCWTRVFCAEQLRQQVWMHTVPAVTAFS